MAEFGREHQDAPDRRDDPDEQERFRRNGVLAERHLHGVEQFHHEHDQQNAVEQRDDVAGALAHAHH